MALGNRALVALELGDVEGAKLQYAEAIALHRETGDRISEGIQQAGLANAHVEATIGYCAQLCAENGTVVWTRARWAPDLVPQICAWFEERGFEQAWLSAPNYTQCTGAHRRIAPPDPLDPAAVMFTFTNHNPKTGPSRS